MNLRSVRTAAGGSSPGRPSRRDGAGIEIRERARTAAEEGLAWLDERFRGRPGAVHPGNRRYLLALEKAGTTAGVRSIGDRAWYEETATRLLECQGSTGFWLGPRRVAASFQQRALAADLTSACILLLADPHLPPVVTELPPDPAIRDGDPDEEEDIRTSETGRRELLRASGDAAVGVK